MSPTTPSRPSVPSTHKPGTNGAPGAGPRREGEGAPGDLLRATDAFQPRHIGPDEAETREMLGTIGYSSLEELAAATVPGAIRMRGPLKLTELPAEGFG